MSFDQKIFFFKFLLELPHIMPDWFAKYQEAGIIFPDLKKKII